MQMVYGFEGFGEVRIVYRLTMDIRILNRKTRESARDFAQTRHTGFFSRKHIELMKSSPSIQLKAYLF